MRCLALTGAATDGLLGTVAGLAGWSEPNIELAGVIATIIGGAIFIALPDTVARRRR